MTKIDMSPMLPPMRKNSQFEAWLTDSGMTATEAAKLFGLSDARLSLVRRGLSTIKLREALKIQRTTNKAVPAESWDPEEYGERRLPRLRDCARPLKPADDGSPFDAP